MILNPYTKLVNEMDCACRHSLTKSVDPQNGSRVWKMVKYGCPDMEAFTNDHVLIRLPKCSFSRRCKMHCVSRRRICILRMIASWHWSTCSRCCQLCSPTMNSSLRASCRSHQFDKHQRNTFQMMAFTQVFLCKTKFLARIQGCTSSRNRGFWLRTRGRSKRIS